jgi:hypothetical protein
MDEEDNRRPEDRIRVRQDDDEMGTERQRDYDEMGTERQRDQDEKERESQRDEHERHMEDSKSGSKPNEYD